MAWVQNRAGSWRILFRYHSRQHTFWLGEVSEAEANTVAAKVDYWLMRLMQNLVALPPGCDVVTFVQHDGNPPSHVPVVARPELTLGGLQDAYFRTHADKLEAITLDGIRLHFKHLARILGNATAITSITRTELQGYIDQRSREWIDPNVYRRQRRTREKDAPKRPRKNARRPTELLDKPRRHPSAATIKKELVSLRTAWNWARSHQMIRDDFPGKGLAYPKLDESLPFMTWDEARRRVDAGDDPDKVWDCVYLRPDEITELLAWANGRPLTPCVHPMLCFAAYTGARRSEIVRVMPSDLDLASGVVTIREKKRDKRKNTTRQVPLAPQLKGVLDAWVSGRPQASTLFCKPDGSAVSPGDAQNYFKRGLRASKWGVLRGWHVFRHSFISALASKGVDQRVIDDLVGHSTEEQRRRYRHLYPSTKQDALRLAFE